MDQNRGTREAHPVMTCGECGRQAAWNPVGYCDWTCFDARPRDPTPGPSPSPAYFFNLGPPTPTHDHP
ncbi:hypothetical protein [Kitasatospora indigofera]|uniref:hypothetical protein n=1 Tax=Kitasatospora indigofera TaxID=67307 RepID=UPI0033B5B98E